MQGNKCIIGLVQNFACLHFQVVVFNNFSLDVLEEFANKNYKSLKYVFVNYNTEYTKVTEVSALEDTESIAKRKYVMVSVFHICFIYWVSFTKKNDSRI